MEHFAAKILSLRWGLLLSCGQLWSLLRCIWRPVGILDAVLHWRYSYCCPLQQPLVSFDNKYYLASQVFRGGHAHHNPQAQLFSSISETEGRDCVHLESISRVCEPSVQTANLNTHYIYCMWACRDVWKVSSSQRHWKFEEGTTYSNLCGAREGRWRRLHKPFDIIEAIADQGLWMLFALFVCLFVCLFIRSPTMGIDNAPQRALPASYGLALVSSMCSLSCYQRLGWVGKCTNGQMEVLVIDQNLQK